MRNEKTNKTQCKRLVKIKNKVEINKINVLKKHVVSQLKISSTQQRETFSHCYLIYPSKIFWAERPEQTVWTQIRCPRIWHIIRVYTVYQSSRHFNIHQKVNIQVQSKELTLRKHAYSNILKNLLPNNENFQIKKTLFFIFLLKT